jgi:hypothetical protein
LHCESLGAADIIRSPIVPGISQCFQGSYSDEKNLYIDGTKVAADADFVGGVQTTGDLYIGAGQALDGTSFFSGLIDDIRIYNQALSADEIAVLAR